MREQLGEPVAEHLFRHESARIVAALCRVFGVHNLALAEDVVQDAWCAALQAWQARGVPEQPAAWLMTTAKNRALDALRRERTANRLAPELARALESDQALAPWVEQAFSPACIRDEQLRMMLSCCHPRLAEEAQLALILNVLCGFAAPEIAAAQLCSRAAIEKRLSRGKRTLAASGSLFDLRDAELPQRLQTVQHALYLLFNEGYHGSTARGLVRPELCQEALRLCALLREQPPADTPTTHALYALMCLNAARLPTRLDAAGALLAPHERDRSREDATLIARGLDALEASASGTELSRYHVEAAIAAAHASASSLAETDFALIVSLYDRLLELAPSPVVELNRAIALGERDGAEAGLAALHAIADRRRLADYPFLPAAIAELERRRGDRESARRALAKAADLARNDAERAFLLKRLSELDREASPPPAKKDSPARRGRD